MSTRVGLSTSQIANYSPIQILVTLLPCCHTVERLFSERQQTKTDGGCELKGKECGICGDQVDSYTPPHSIGDIFACKFGHEKSVGVNLTYPGPSAVFKSSGHCDWNKIYDCGEDLCRIMAFESITNNSVVREFKLLGHKDGTVALVVLFKKGSFFGGYLEAHGVAHVHCPEESTHRKTCTHEELKTVFSIIARNNKIPTDKVNRISEIVERGACDPLPNPLNNHLVITGSESPY